MNTNTRRYRPMEPDATTVLETLGGLTQILAMAVSFVLGIIVTKFPKKSRRLNMISGELGEALSTAAKAMADGKISPAELRAILKESKDVIKAATVKLDDTEA
jgi:hypothetical protein